MNNIFYTYVYLDPRKSGRFSYNNFVTYLYEPFYVGKGSTNRINCHLYNYHTHWNSHKYSKIKKIRKENLEPIIIKSIDKIEEKCSFCYESFLIDSIGRSDLGLGPLVNHTNGGEGGSGIIMSEESKRKIRELKLGHKDSTETKLRKSLSRIGSKNPAFGKVWIHNDKESILVYKERLKEYLNKGWIKGVIEYTRNKTSIQWKGTFKSKEHKLKIGLGNKGKTLGRKAGEEERRKKSIARLGNKNPARISKFKKELQIYMVAF